MHTLNKWLQPAVRFVLAGLFGWAGIAKALDIPVFAQEIANYRFLPGLAPYLAATLPGIELAVALVLLLGNPDWRRAAALVALGLLTAFTVAAAQALLRRIEIECGCFGRSSSPLTWWTLARDLVLLAMAALLLWKSKPREAN